MNTWTISELDMARMGLIADKQSAMVHVLNTVEKIMALNRILRGRFRFEWHEKRGNPSVGIPPGRFCPGRFRRGV